MGRIHRTAAVLLFLYAFVLYGATISPSTAFWDTGEFIASAHGLQVMHPPGAPFYMLLGRVFSMFVPAPLVALAVNLVSVLAAALTVTLSYLIVVQFVHLWQHRHKDAPGAWDETIAAAAGLIGALTLTASDSFWFNAVEAEVYALSTFFIAFTVWLVLLWSKRITHEGIEKDSPFAGDSNRYLVLIAYLFGLSVGIHLMSVLTYAFVALIVFFSWFDRPAWSGRMRLFKLISAGAIACGIFLAIYPGLVITLPELAGKSGAAGFFLLSVIALITGGMYYAHRERRPLLHLTLVCTAALLLGYSSYLLIPIRSTANPPIDLNNPETAEALVPYLKREQYALPPLLKGATYDDHTGQINTEDPALLPRRHSAAPEHIALYRRYGSDWDYFIRYQTGHMYLRYFLWNFAGRAHDEQNAGWDAGFRDAGDLPHTYITPSERASRNAYFALPLLLGIIGMVYHFRRDWRRASALLALCVITGIGLVVYLNEIPATPRERDYIYAGSYLAFCIWIGIGAAGLLEGLHRIIHRRVPALWSRIALTSLAGLIAVAVPLRMVEQNYDDHDRSGNYLARDFAYNLLMSLEENAILFTGGDNDTYPLWYLQSVEGVRRDVRVVCLPLLHSSWYARQLRHQSAYDAAPLPISLSEVQIDGLQPIAWEPQEVQLPVDPAVLRTQTELNISVEDTSGFESPMRWLLQGRPYNVDLRVLFPADLVILNVLAENARQGWTRPVYFAATSSPSDQLGLQQYFQREGLAYRIVPIRHEEPDGRVVPRLMLKRLADFRFTNLKNPNVYFADDARGWAGYHYRFTYVQTADTLIEEQQPEMARRVMAALMDEVPPDTIPLHPVQALSISRVYLMLGEEALSTDVMQAVEPRVLTQLRTAATAQEMEQVVRLAQAVQLAYVQSRAFENAAAMSRRMADLLGDDALRQTPEYFEKLYQQLTSRS